MFRLSKSVSKLKKVSKSKPNEEIAEKEKKVKKIKQKVNKNGMKSDDKKKKTKGLTKGVVMVSHIPHGFYEKQMFDYFSQFGKVLRLRFSKNRKTGQRRNYAFIEFECEEVAKIAANTMNDYLMFDHILKCKFMPSSEMPAKLFRDWNKPFVSSTQIHKSLHNRNKSIEREFQLMKRHLKKVRLMENHLKEKGIDFTCQVINRPDMARLRQEQKIETNGKDVVVEPKGKAVRPLLRQKKAVSERKAVKRSPKSEGIVQKRVELTPKVRKCSKSPRFPKLYKFSLILSANKRKSFKRSSL